MIHPWERSGGRQEKLSGGPEWVAIHMARRSEWPGELSRLSVCQVEAQHHQYSCDPSVIPKATGVLMETELQSALNADCSQYGTEKGWVSKGGFFSTAKFVV